MIYRRTKPIRQPLYQTAQVLMVVSCVLFGACSWVPKGESALDIGIRERGVASWYGAEFHGKLAADGTVFNMEALTAAHRTLPLGSMVRVVNLINGKHVRVRISDRGPYINGRILDLSYAAAAQLGMVDQGLSVIQLEVVGDHRPDFLLDAEDRRESLPIRFLMNRTPDERVSLAMPTLIPGTMDYKNPSPYRYGPNDLLVQRRWKWPLLTSSADPAHQPCTGRMIS